jgi:hypothetical protein
MEPRTFYHLMIAAQVIVVAIYFFFVELKDDEK